MPSVKKPAFPVEKARMMYNEFPEPRDMTFEKFYEELLDMANPIAMARDYHRMRLTLSIEGENKRKIQRALAQQANIKHITSN